MTLNGFHVMRHSTTPRLRLFVCALTFFSALVLNSVASTEYGESCEHTRGARRRPPRSQNARRNCGGGSLCLQLKMPYSVVTHYPTLFSENPINN